jgi:hypothetical protein
MDGMDLRRRIGWSRSEAALRAKMAVLARGQRADAASTAAECARIAREPSRRWEGVRRSLGAARASAP